MPAGGEHLEEQQADSTTAVVTMSEMAEVAHNQDLPLYSVKSELEDDYSSAGEYTASCGPVDLSEGALRVSEN